MSGRLGPGRGWLGAALPSGGRVELAGNTGEQPGVGGGRSRLLLELSYLPLPLLIKQHPHFFLLIKPIPTHLLSVNSIRSQMAFTRITNCATIPWTVLVYCADITMNGTPSHSKVS